MDQNMKEMWTEFESASSKLSHIKELIAKRQKGCKHNLIKVTTRYGSYSSHTGIECEICGTTDIHSISFTDSLEGMHHRLIEKGYTQLPTNDIYNVHYKL